jgi:riboflavin kinase / FMN adenylyltransferase
MLVFNHIDDAARSLTASVVTLGNFDGIHLGHQALVGRTVEEARRRNAVAVVLTFDPHPLKFLAPARAPRLILAAEDKIELFRGLGIDVVINQRFDASFARLEAEEFVRRSIVDRLKAKKLWVGSDLRFGQGRKGSVEQLIGWGVELGFEVSIVEPILVNGVRVSSSQIRALIEEGRVDEARPLLGRFHFVSGTVVDGNRRGRGLGFPTANIASRTEVIPSDGIYATLFCIGNEQRQSVSSIGVNPTFGEGPRTLESYILEFDRDIYGQTVKVAFLKKLRGEKKFADVAALSAQIHEDVRNARAVFASRESAGRVS